MIYSPAEDSYLLEKQVKRFSKNKVVLDMGSGSGIQAIAAKSSGAKSVLAADLNEEVISHLKKIGINSVKSDLFENISGEFDLIIFNPPYLPSDVSEDSESQLATTGGEKGDEVILRFLDQSINHLKKNGVILMLISSLTPTDNLNKFLNKHHLKQEKIASEKMFMETLYVIKISF